MRVNGRNIAASLNALDLIDRGGVRDDFRSAARLAKDVIQALYGKPTKAMLRKIAKEIADRASVRPQVVYRTKKFGGIRWQSANTISLHRIPKERIVGTYDAGNDYRTILEDLTA